MQFGRAMGRNGQSGNGQRIVEGRNGEVAPGKERRRQKEKRRCSKKQVKRTMAAVRRSIVTLQAGREAVRRDGGNSWQW